MRFGGLGLVELRRSAEPDFEVEALFPCFASKRSDEAIIDDVVEMLNVE